MALPPGTRLGPFEVLSPLGAGGMGEVYRARDTRLGREVAVKVLPEHLSASPEDRTRFQREAKAISALNHPHICTLHDLGREGETDYLVMELVEGEILSQRLLRGPLPTADVLKLGAQIANALDRAHRAGVIHRDLKPGNVMLTRTGVKLMDFGLARVTGRGTVGPGAVTASAPGGAPKSDEPITAKGTVVGTVQYMAPEQLEGERGDARSDLWSLGCVLYEMATGKRAFEGSTQASIISAIMRDQPRPISQLVPLAPPAFERAVRQCLAKDPDDRWQSAGDLDRELTWIVEAGTQAAVAEPRAARPGNRERVAWGVAGFLLVLGIVAAILLWRSHQNEARPFTFTPLTYKPMAIFKAAFAPDGKTIAFSAALEGNTPRVFVLRPEYPEPEPLSDPATHLLAVSSRGELAVLTDAIYNGMRRFRGTLARMPLGGGAPREILKNVSEADWSPDGRQLAIVRQEGGECRLEFPIGNILCNSDGSLTDMRFSPGGDRIAFFEHPSGDGDEGSVNVVDLHGKRTVLSDGYWGEEGLAWSADGTEVLFSACHRGAQFTVYAVTLGGSSRVAMDSAGGQTIQDVSRDGRWLITRDEVRTAAMVHRPEWRDDRDLSWLEYSGGGQLSKDADVIVFNEQSAAVDGIVVCLRKTDGSPVVRLGEGASLQVSPDGKWVATRIPSSPPQLVIQPTGAGQPKRLERGSIETYGNAWWFPDEDSLLISGREHGRPPRHFVQAIKGGPPRALTAEGSTQAAIARDGSWVMARGADGQVLRYRFDGSAPRVVPWLTPNDRLLPWDLDGRSVLVVSGPIRTIPLRVERVDLVTGRRTLFAEVAPTDRVGLMGCLLTDVADNYLAYAYDASWMLSSLFLAQPGTGSSK